MALEKDAFRTFFNFITCTVRAGYKILINA